LVFGTGAFLDSGCGDTWLKRPDIAALVSGALRYFDGQRYTLLAWVVMPNHVHAVVRPEAPHTLSVILKSWKGYTAVHANRLLHREGKPFWRKESYDHFCRNEQDRARCCTYTTMNPVKARLCHQPTDWPWSSAHVGQVSDLPVKPPPEASSTTFPPEALAGVGDSANRQVGDLPHAGWIGKGAVLRHILPRWRSSRWWDTFLADGLRRFLTLMKTLSPFAG
jgi:REP element-mobilizing transposase RayT